MSLLCFSLVDNRYRVDSGVAGINGKRHPDSSGLDEDGNNNNNNNNEVSYDASKSKAHPSGRHEQQQEVIGIAGVVLVNVVIILTRNCLLEKHALIVN